MFQEIPVEYEFIRIVEELQRKRTGFKVSHGPILRSGNTPEDVGKPAIDPTVKHPLLIFKEHILVNDTRIVTCLQKHDPEGTLCVNKEQFMEALDVSPSQWFSMFSLHRANCRATDATAGHELPELANYYNLF